VLAVCWISFAAVLFFPLRTGEVVRPYLITKRASIRGWQALGTVGAERIIDGLLLSCILLAALSLSMPLDPLPDAIGELQIPVAAVPGAAYGAVVLFSCCFVLMVLFYLRRRWALRATRATIGLVSQRVAERLANVVQAVANGLKFLPSVRHTAPFVLETVAYWTINALGFWLLAYGCGLRAIGFAEACVIMGCLGIGILVPAGPGFFGTFQLSVYMALAMYVLPSKVAGAGAAFVFVAYCCQLFLHVLGAAVGYLLFRSLPAEAADQTAAGDNESDEAHSSREELGQLELARETGEDEIVSS